MQADVSQLPWLQWNSSASDLVRKDFQVSPEKCQGKQDGAECDLSRGPASA